MPIYQYKCNNCKLEFEEKNKFSDSISVKCPNCDSIARKIFAPVPIIYKGSGFYCTDNSNTHSSNS